MDILEKIEACKFRAEAGGEEYRIATDTVFGECLRIPESKRSTGDAVRLTGVMRRLGWNGPERMYFADARRRGDCGGDEPGAGA